MQRRTFVIGLSGAAATFGMPAAAHTTDFEPGVIATALAAGETVLVEYAADWCIVCQAQGWALDELKAENPGYDEKITFIRVDWDIYESQEVAWGRGVMARSTLLLLKGEDELGRLTAQTDKEAIRALLDQAL